LVVVVKESKANISIGTQKLKMLHVYLVLILILKEMTKVSLEMNRLWDRKRRLHIPQNEIHLLGNKIILSEKTSKSNTLAQINVLRIALEMFSQKE
jgi:hypothetical protein